MFHDYIQAHKPTWLWLLQTVSLSLCTWRWVHEVVHETLTHKQTSTFKQKQTGKLRLRMERYKSHASQGNWKYWGFLICQKRKMQREKEQEELLRLKNRTIKSVRSVCIAFKTWLIQKVTVRWKLSTVKPQTPCWCWIQRRSETKEKKGGMGW